MLDITGPVCCEDFAGDLGATRPRPPASMSEIFENADPKTKKKKFFVFRPRVSGRVLFLYSYCVDNRSPTMIWDLFSTMDGEGVAEEQKEERGGGKMTAAVSSIPRSPISTDISLPLPQ